MRDRYLLIFVRFISLTIPDSVNLCFQKSVIIADDGRDLERVGKIGTLPFCPLTSFCNSPFYKCVCLVTWLLSEGEAGDEFVLIQASKAN